MDYKEKLGVVRKSIDEIDEQMIALFKARMKCVDEVANIKSENNISIVDANRERIIIESKTEGLHGSEKGEVTIFFRSMMAISKARQRARLLGDKTVEQSLLPPAREPIGENVNVAFQGSQGAWTEVASIKVFPNATHKAFENWEDVFIAVKNKTMNYGVLPVENSQTGAIGEVYDLLRKYGCYIVGQTWVPIHHCLFGTQDATVDTISEVHSHPQGFAQCGKFLRKAGWDLSACRNTAVAAEKVSQLNNVAHAAIGSARAASLNGLKILNENIVDRTDNKTRFIVISDTPEYNDTSDTVSVIFRTTHHSGALVDVLFPLMSENVNLTRLESRPVADGKYCFFADLEGNINDERILSALKQIDVSCGFLEILGCYSTIY